MKSEMLKQLLETYKGKSNKELSTIAMGLFNDFQTIKGHMIELTETIEEIEGVYNKVLNELQSRLHFEDPKKPENVIDGD